MQHDLDASPSGISKLIKDSQLRVPPHQRDYSWTLEEVSQLLTDVNTAFEKGKDYFLGSIMLIKDDESQSRFSIVDGQQRLATVTILISAIRNYFKNHDTANDRHADIERDFLFKTDLRTRERDFNLVLSERDSELFEKILTTPENIDYSQDDRLIATLKKCDEHIQSIIQSVNNPVEKLLDFHDYLLERAQIIAVKVNNEASAYVIFETLNDRGLSLSLADLFKNYLFGLSDDKIEVAKSKWSSLIGAFASQDAESELTDFIRYYWLSKYGYLNERQLFNELKSKINSKSQAVEFIEELDEMAGYYLALDNPGHDTWTKLGADTVIAVQNINQVNFIQYKPLALAVLQNIHSNREVKKIISRIENWTVRLVYGSGTRSGTIAEKFSEVAVKISKGELTNAQAIAAEIAPIIPDDAEFKEQFATVGVRNANTARYLLRKIENKERANNGIREELGVSEDTNKVNLEHILPKKADLNLWNFDVEEHAKNLNRLGNQTLLLSKDNSTTGVDEYSTKITYYQNSELITTKQIPVDFSSWNPDAVNQRQEKLAQIASQAWPKN